MVVSGKPYDASAGIIETALRYGSTIIPMVLEGKEFWVLLFLNLTVSITRHMDLIDPKAFHLDLPWGLTGVTGSLMTFFVCFYNQHVFGRYNKLYNLTKKMCETCLEIVSILRVQVPNKAHQRKVAKLVVSSCFMFFYERTESENGGSLSDKELEQLRQLNLLGDAEIAHLKQHCTRYKEDAVPSFLVLQWAMQLMRSIIPNPEERDDMLAGFYGRIYRVRKCQAEVTQILDLPMPFQYFHIMNLMLMLNLVLWAYSLGCQDSLFAPVIYCFVQMMFQGIRELSTALSDPFGDDEVDFPVNAWMLGVYARMYGVLEDPYDISKLDLNRVTPLLDPEERVGNKGSKVRDIINVYVDLLETEEAQDTRKTKNGYQKVSQRDDDEDKDPLLQRKINDRRNNTSIRNDMGQAFDEHSEPHSDSD